ncbi:MAG: CBS domain-containing protein [Firmicutes bacterium]|nr:CBS domain-containing protein [Bacillota bacterium]
MFFMPDKHLVKDVMSKDFIILYMDTLLDDALKMMLKKNSKEIFIVNRKEKIQGLLTLSDISNIFNSNDSLNKPIRDFIDCKLVTVKENTTLIKCRDIMLKNKIGRLPVIEKQLIKGVIRQEEIRKYYYMNLEEIAVKLNHVIDNIHEAVCGIDAKGKVLIWNKNAEKLYNLKSEKIIGNKLKDFFPNAINLEVLKNKKPIRNKYHSPKEGEYVIISSFPIYREDGKFIGVVSTDKDITEIKKLSSDLQKANDTVKYLETQVKKLSDYNFGNVIGNSKVMVEKIKQAKQVAETKATILITGESGTGKEVFAKAIHGYSGEKGVFVPVNCSAIPHELFESEFFGYEKGAFTGASSKGKIGYFELSHNGTIFLDEIGDLPMFMQAKLLRVLQEKKIKRVGGENRIDVDFRVISATNKDLKKMVEEGTFRRDLYYRLDVINIDLPPLRDRGRDIVLLINSFLKELAKRNNKNVPKIDKEVMEILLKYKWEGNIRELKNTIEQLIVMAYDGIITKGLLPKYIINDVKDKVKRNDTKETLDLNEAIKRVEIEKIKHALEKTNGNKSKASKLLNIPRATLYYKMRTYNI